MKALVTPDEMSRIEARTMRHLNLTSYDLMNRVATALADELQNEADSFCILCGPGNNGGDGWRLAEILRQRGRSVVVCDILSAETPDGIKAKKTYRGIQWQTSISDQVASYLLKRPSTLLVDAIFGCRGRETLPRPVRTLLRLVNSLSKRRIAIDLPTGLNAATGAVASDAFCADLTWTIGYPKTVFMNEAAAAITGEIRCLDLEFSPAPSTQMLWALEDSDFSPLPDLKSGYKTLYGRCGIIGGSSQTPTAPLLAAEAAARMHAGYVTLYFADRRMPRMTLSRLQFLYPNSWKTPQLERETALVLGCGGPPPTSVTRWLTSHLPSCTPIVLDAEALPVCRSLRQRPLTLLTPHWGEARSLHPTRRLYHDDRLRCLDELQSATGHSVYLKGAPGLLKFSSSKNIYVNLSINPIFSRAGSGDILAGILGASMARYFAGLKYLANSKVRPKNKPSSENADELFQRATINALLIQKKVGDLLRAQSRGSTLVNQLDTVGSAEEVLRQQRDKQVLKRALVKRLRK